MSKQSDVCFYRFNWVIFEAQWKVIFIILKLLLLIAHLAQSLG